MNDEAVDGVPTATRGREGAAGAWWRGPAVRPGPSPPEPSDSRRSLRSGEGPCRVWSGRLTGGRSWAPGGDEPGARKWVDRGPAP
jgi:hypothetical protein